MRHDGYSCFDDRFYGSSVIGSHLEFDLPSARLLDQPAGIPERLFLAYWIPRTACLRPEHALPRGSRIESSRPSHPWLRNYCLRAPKDCDRHYRRRGGCPHWRDRDNRRHGVIVSSHDDDLLLFDFHLLNIGDRNFAIVAPSPQNFYITGEVTNLKEFISI